MCEVGGEWEDMSPPVKIIVPPAKKKKLFRGGCQNVPPRHKYRKKLNVFYTTLQVTTRQQFVKSVCESTKNMLKAAVLQFFSDQI